MKMDEIIRNAENNITKALSDYRLHTYQTEVLDNVTQKFIHQLAVDSSYAKQDLRELFRKSPVYDAKLDALIINGTRTHNPDYNRVYSLACSIMNPVRSCYSYNSEEYLRITRAIDFFATPPDVVGSRRELGIEAINELAPKAYSPTKKLSRVFMALCEELGLADKTAGGEFQKLYAQLADELSAKKIGYKLYASLNPAHFITMSNPKGDERGNCLTSCHSFNSREYGWNCGCTGYARDDTSFIVFTAADPANPETLNNRKTTRQIFAYMPGNGLLLQSRMYNTSGGTYGAQEESKLYRDLIQRELSALEEQPNLWKTGQYYGKHEDCVRTSENFGGYPDWIYSDFDAKVSIREDCKDSWAPITVGAAGLCICCGDEISCGLLCDDCDNEDNEECDCCGGYFDEDDMRDVRDSTGNWIRVCEECREENYCRCESCGDYYPSDQMTEIDGEYYCSECRDDIAELCADCGEWHRHEDMTLVHNDRGSAFWVCENCRCDNYFYCDDCGECHPSDEQNAVYKTSENNPEYVCADCAEEYELCPHCDELIERQEDGTCPYCGTVIAEEKRETA